MLTPQTRTTWPSWSAGWMSPQRPPAATCAVPSPSRADARSPAGRQERPADSFLSTGCGTNSRPSSTAVFEVEPAKTWRRGVSQVLSYSAQTRLPPAIALFGAIHHDALLKLYLKIRHGMGRANYGAIALWWWAGAAWTPISSRARCRNMPAPGPQ